MEFCKETKLCMLFFLLFCLNCVPYICIIEQVEWKTQHLYTTPLHYHAQSAQCLCDPLSQTISNFCSVKKPKAIHMQMLTVTLPTSKGKPSTCWVHIYIKSNWKNKHRKTDIKDCRGKHTHTISFNKRKWWKLCWTNRSVNRICDMRIIFIIFFTQF